MKFLKSQIIIIICLFWNVVLLSQKPLTSFLFNKYQPGFSSQVSFYNYTNSILTADSMKHDYLMIDGTYWRTYSDINIPRFAAVLGSMVLIDAIVQKKQSEYWYTKETTKFHSVDFSLDFDRYKQMDKLGHFTDAYFVSDLTAKAYRWSGVSGSSSVWLGALTGWLWTLQIEFYDAHSPKWGWSWGDILANTIGSGFFVLQQFNYDMLGGIQPKFSYHLSEEWEKYGSNKFGNNLILDYSGMTFWITVNPHHYFPESWKKEFSEWLAPLGIAFGFGVNGVIFNSLEGERELYIGLDIDLRKIPLGDDSGLLKFLKSEFNFIRLPLPAVRITPSGVWYGLYF